MPSVSAKYNFRWSDFVKIMLTDTAGLQKFTNKIALKIPPVFNMQKFMELQRLTCNTIEVFLIMAKIILCFCQ